jgi:hypothetical protein
MPRNSKIWIGNRSQQDSFRTVLVLFSAWFFVASCVQSLGAETRRALTDAELDTVTAGGAKVSLELSSTAQGPAAFASTQGSILRTHSPVLHVAVDPLLPVTMRAKLLGVITAELIFANGKANAAGASNVQCSAIPVAAGDAAYVAQSAMATTISAMCFCSGFAIGILPQ